MTGTEAVAVLLRSAPLVLTGGSMFERLRRDSRVRFDPDLAHGALIYDDAARALLRTVHGEYLDVARRHGLPMLVSSSTWRATEARIARSKLAGERVNQDNVAFVRRLVAERGDQGAPMLVVGQLGPRGDAYRANEAPGFDEAVAFHAYQVGALSEGAPDLLMAVTLPSVDEARGIARLLEETGRPYLLSFVVRRDGCVLDGTPLDVAIARIDDERERPPLGYLVNCVHPEVLGEALSRAPAATGRVLGLRANTSSLRPDELDGSRELVTQAPEALAAHMAAVRGRFALRIVGGCCGTGTAHLEQMAAACATEVNP